MELKDIKYSFKEACKLTGYKDSVIRYYEKEFNLNITRDSNGRRVFTKNDIEKLLYIKNLQQQGLNNSQIKKLMANDEVAVTLVSSDFLTQEINATDINNDMNNNEDIAIIKTIEDKLNEINTKLEELDKNVFNKERDILISENMKLKMELKQKCYEIIELKEKLRYEKENKKGLLKRLFKNR